MDDAKLALFTLLGQTATKTLGDTPDIAHSESLLISDSFDLSSTIPEAVKAANRASYGYKLFFVFENYLREFVIDTLTKGGKEAWWDKTPTDVQQEVERNEDKEETKAWMALGSRDKSALLTYPQLLKIIDHQWKDYFKDIIRDRALVQTAAHISHLRNTLCHMTTISAEEEDRIRQVMRDWFRVVSP